MFYSKLNEREQQHDNLLKFSDKVQSHIKDKK